MHHSLGQFLRQLQDLAIPGYFSYSLTGDAFTDKQKQNPVGSIFALKLYAMLGERKASIIQPIIDRLLSFQCPNGTFVDPFVLHRRRLYSTLSHLKRRQWPDFSGTQYIRAETRQAYSALLLHDVTPHIVLEDVPTRPDEIRRFLSNLDWSHPWGAGGHFSHLLFFLSLLHTSRRINEPTFQQARMAATSFLNDLQRDDGAWYIGSPSPRQKINGAMKVISGLVVDDLPCNRTDKLIDLCLSHPANSMSDACDQINQIFVLRYCDRLLDHTYRRGDTTSFCKKALEDWQEYYYPNLGGFSFYKHRANDRYYGAKISRGLDEPDIHGTVLFVWGLSMLKELIPIPELVFLHEIKT
ncbi:hypothetical protein FJZ48_03180 [Candidatus Uhrbacteria bacterium]|nr:hypothetical protein [Candidatus Uhrbacteria bacterium]